MIRSKDNSPRRKFLKICGLSTLPLFIPKINLGNNIHSSSPILAKENHATNIHFVGDGLHFSPQEYLQKLTDINAAKSIQPDFYGNGGVTKELENTFATLTGKEKAIFVPTGTMANQLAIKLLNQDNTKVMVPENSHVFRDEADAAQMVHNKRLIPVGKGKAYFDLQDLKETIAYYDSGEVFKSGLGTIVIEHPVRRAEGTAVPIETIKDIAAFCKQQGYKLHLDGARLHIAAAYTGVSIQEYASYFDTVYISLYKYLNASGGAILCGDSKTIDKMSHQIKVHGGTAFQTWNQSAMALHYLNGLEERWKEVVTATNQLFSALDKTAAFKTSKIEHGTNQYHLTIAKSVDFKKFGKILSRDYRIFLPRQLNANRQVTLTVNESILGRSLDQVIGAFKQALKDSNR